MNKILVIIFILSVFSSWSQQNYEDSISLRALRKIVLQKMATDDYEGAWKLAQRGYERAKKSEYQDSMIAFISSKAIIQSELGSENKAVELNLEAIQLARKYGMGKKTMVGLFVNIGIGYKNLEDYDRSLSFLKQAESIIEDCPECESLLGHVVVSIAGTFIGKSELDSAEYYLTDKVDELQSSIRSSDEFRASYNYWLSRLYEEKGAFQMAMDHLSITARIDSVSGNWHKYNQDRLQLGELFNAKNEKQKALRLFEECLDSGKKFGQLKLQHVSLERLYSIHLELGDSLKALGYLLDYNVLNDSLLKENNQVKIRRIEFNHSLQQMELVKNHEIEQLKTKEEKSRLSKWITIVSALLIILVLIALGEYIRKKYKQSLLVKKKELALYTTEISSKNEAINNAVLSLEKQISITENSAQLRSTLNDLKFELKNEDFWKDFELRFRDVQAGFYKTLMAAHPDLTKNEVRLCAFIKLKMTTKEMAALTKKSTNSVDVAKHRLKKKMNLPENQTLFSYINSEAFDN